MHVLILGATGRTGKYLVEELLEQNHKVTCLVRNKDKITNTHPALTIIEGNPMNYGDIEIGIRNVECVMTVLNVSRKSDFPWSGLRAPENLLSQSMAHVIRASKYQSLSKVVICSAFGAADSRPFMPGWFRWLIDHSNIGIAYRDHERQEELIKASDLNWTILRPTGLTNSTKPEKVRYSFNNSPTLRLFISRKSVAKAMIDAMENPDLVNKIPGISAD